MGPGAGDNPVGVRGVGFGAGLAVFLDVGLGAGGEGDDGWGPAGVDLGVEVLLFELVEVGARVRGLVFEHLHEAVEGGGEEGAEGGAGPVDLGGFVG